MPTAFIIGASRGIGYEFARQLCADKWKIYATARDDEGVARLKALGAEAFKLDVTDVESVAAVGWRLDDEKLDLVVYVAGVLGKRVGAQNAPTTKEFDEVMHANVLGAMQLIPQVAPMVEATHGRFAFISSQMGSIGDAQSSTPWLYRTSKAALNMVIRAAAHDYPKATLLAMSPGWVKTDMGGDSAPLTVEQSVSGMRAVIAAAKQDVSGSFLNYAGQVVPW